MPRHIEAEALTTFEVTTDGERLTLNAEDSVGEAVSMSLPTACLTQMVLTLPRMAQMALRRRHRDDSLRIVYIRRRPGRSNAARARPGPTS